MTDNDILTEVRHSIIFSGIYYRLKHDYLFLIQNCYMNRKQMILFLTKMKTVEQKIAYINRFLIKCAFKYGVPKVIIKNYINNKEHYNSYLHKKRNIYYYNNKNSTEKKLEYKEKLFNSYKLLYESTKEMIIRSNSRKEKLNNILDKIIEKHN